MSDLHLGIGVAHRQRCAGVPEKRRVVVRGMATRELGEPDRVTAQSRAPEQGAGDGAVDIRSSAKRNAGDLALARSVGLIASTTDLRSGRRWLRAESSAAPDRSGPPDVDEAASSSLDAYARSILNSFA